MFVTCNAVIGQAVKSWLTICLPAHQNITAYGLSLLIGLGRVAIFAIGLRKNQNDYVKLLIKHTTRVVCSSDCFNRLACSSLILPSLSDLRDSISMLW